MNHFKGIDIMMVGFAQTSTLESDVHIAFPGSRVISTRTVHEGMKKITGEQVFIFPVLLLPGFEYEKLCSQAAVLGNRALIGKPLLHHDKGIMALAKILWREYGAVPTLFAGHGSSHCAGMECYKKLETALHGVGFSNALLGVLNGQPNFDSVAAWLLREDVRQLPLIPLMLSSGKHVRRELFGDNAESWKNRLAAMGISISSIAGSLLELSAVRNMFVSFWREKFF